jgi:hypothetical protein
MYVLHDCTLTGEYTSFAPRFERLGRSINCCIEFIGRGLRYSR